MAVPKYNNFEFDDGINFVTTSIDEDRSAAPRSLTISKIPRREGVQITDIEDTNKSIIIKGKIYNDTVSGFRTNVDNFHKAVGVKSGTLEVFAGRTYTVEKRRAVVTQNNFEVTIADFEVEFVTSSPFSQTAQETVSLTVTSGVLTQTDTITISGTAYARPIITYTAPIGDGGSPTPTQRIDIEHISSGTIVTWSGTPNYVTYSGQVAFNYLNLTTSADGSLADFSGIFETWDPGDNDMTVTFSGGVVGGNIDFSYQPQYY